MKALIYTIITVIGHSDDYSPRTLDVITIIITVSIVQYQILVIALRSCVQISQLELITLETFFKIFILVSALISPSASCTLRQIRKAFEICFN